MSETRKESVIHREETALFLPNNHSETRVLWKKTGKEKIAEALDVLLFHYPYTHASNVRQSAQLEQRSNNFRITTEKKDVVLKKNIAVTEQGPLILTERLLEYLRNEGIPVQKIIQPKEGSSPVEAHEHLWQLFAFIEGSHYGGTKSQLIDVASWIGKLHVALSRVPFADEIAAKPMVEKQKTPEGIAAIFANAPHLATLTDRLIAEHVPFLVEQHSAHIAQTALLKNVPPKVVGKGLMHPHDFFFQGDRMVAIIDFEEAGMYELSRDVGNAVHRLVRRYVEAESPRPWPETLKEGVRLFFDSYRRSNSALTVEDITLVPIFLRADMFNKIHGAYYNPRYADREETRESETRKFILLLKEVSYIKQAVTEYQKGE